MKRKPSVKLPENTQVMITKPVNNTSHKSEIICSSELLAKENVRIGKITIKSNTTTKISNAEPVIVKYKSSSINPSVIKISKTSTEKPPEKLNKFLNFYQSSKIFFL